MHVLVADGQFLLLMDVPIEDREQRLQIYEIFSLPVRHEIYQVNTKTTANI